MKKVGLVLVSLLCVTTAFAGQGDGFLTLNGGFLFNSTLDATIGYERELSYTDALEFYGEVGDRWEEDPVCGKVCRESFFKNYYWDGGVAYKKCLAVECGLEYNLVFPNRVQLSITQKNQVSFLHGDSFRNGLLVGLKIPF